MFHVILVVTSQHPGWGVDPNHIKIEVLCPQELMAGTFSHDGLQARFISSWKKVHVQVLSMAGSPTRTRNKALVRAY